MNGSWQVIAEYTQADCPHCHGTGEVYGYDGSLGDCYHRSVAWVETPRTPPDALSGPQRAETGAKRGSDHVAGQDDRTDGEGT